VSEDEKNAVEFTTITIRLPHELKEKALKAAEISDTTLTRFVRRALRNEIQRTKPVVT
jgi:predicted transcriptional regulator